MGDLWSKLHPPPSKFEPARDIPDLSGKVIIVTGGNTGIGKETVKELLRKNAKVYMGSRTKARAQQAIDELKQETGKEAIFLELNLANLDSVTQAANEFKSKEKALHVLFNSAGVMTPPVDQFTDGKSLRSHLFPPHTNHSHSVTSDGYDLQFGTNVLGHAHLTLLLIPELLEGAKTHPDGKARVVHTSSDAAEFVQSIEFDTLKGASPKRTKMSAMKLYGQSKFGNVVFSNELARRYGDRITSNAVHPGYLKTELQRHTKGVMLAVMNLILKPVEFGRLTQLYVGTSPEAAQYNGQWFIPYARHSKLPKGTDNAELGLQLWDWIEEQRKSHL